MEERNRNQRQELVTKAGTLVEALPYMRHTPKISDQVWRSRNEKTEYINALQRTLFSSIRLVRNQL